MAFERKSGHRVHMKKTWAMSLKLSLLALVWFSSKSISSWYFLCPIWVCTLLPQRRINATQTPSLCNAFSKTTLNAIFNFYIQTKFPKATTPIPNIAIQTPLPDSLFTAPLLLALALSSAVLTLVLPVATIPFSVSAVLIAGPTLK